MRALLPSGICCERETANLEVEGLVSLIDIGAEKGVWTSHRVLSKDTPRPPQLPFLRGPASWQIGLDISRQLKGWKDARSFKPV